MKKMLKNFDNGKLSVHVSKIEQEEEIISIRPLKKDEDFSSFHSSTILQNTPILQHNPIIIGSYTKNVSGFDINIIRKLK
jgi:nitrogen fixation protein